MKRPLIAALLLLSAGEGALFCTCDRRSTPPRVSFSRAAVTNEMAVVPGGWFRMGSEKGEVDEKPVHRVWVDSFRIDRFPVTNAQYDVFVNETGRDKPLYRDNDKCNAPDQPVVGVTWADAMAFCRWRSAKERARFTLPTEAQWEKAARGEDGRMYPWGNEPPDKKRATCEITEKMPRVGLCELGRSPYGVSDLVGNVWNWCLDWYDKDYYRRSTGRNPAGPSEGTKKVVRGGNWVFLGCCSGTPAYALRSSRRNGFHPSIQKKSIGFRCVSTGPLPAGDSIAVAAAHVPTGNSNE
ncbi:MAG: SUMF1/EgtB/PvdO family nonheme iron enzyme [Chitinispirillaceae bacterium]|nr:SUMF1/EgtB/PvdO family nonheme iron enzyme [Chitinispirillaceae bacterium]